MSAPRTRNYLISKLILILNFTISVTGNWIRRKRKRENKKENENNWVIAYCNIDRIESIWYKINFRIIDHFTQSNVQYNNIYISKW